ncbi:MAG: hypothetical protein H6825_08345 [Planctomycetes bacterium]|nr:hypothetical protein [Planctomycetota bacterium]
MHRSAVPSPRDTARRLLRVAAGALVALMLAVPALAAQTGVCEQDGLIVFETESVATPPQWAVETNVNGYTGAAYLRWNGGDQFSSPGVGTLSYTLNVATAGTYRLFIRNHHDDPDATLENDCWTRVDGSPWLKTYSKFNNQWTWSTRFDPPTGSDVDATYVLSAGTHTFQISGRSQDFRIDRVHFALAGVVDPTNPATPPSPTGDCSAGQWIDLGHALAGSFGEPMLVGTGDLVPNTPAALTLSHALPGTVGVLVLGLTELGAPFKGGVFVPDADVLFVIPIDAAGGLTVPFTWPSNVPSGLSLYWQAWLVDPSGPFGASATNALESQGG